MLNREKKIIGTTLLALFALTPRLGNAGDNLLSLRQRSVEFSQALAQKTSEIDTTSKKLDRLSQEIRSLKEKQKSHALLGQYRLQAKLQEAQELSDQLSAMTEERKKIQQQWKDARLALFKELDRAIEDRRAIANSKEEGWKERNQAAQEMERLLVERAQFSVSFSTTALPKGTARLLESSATPDEITERLDALRDMERRMEKEVVLIESELADARRQRFLRSELTHLMDEESFFSEQGFVRAGGVRSDKDKEAAAAALTKGSVQTKDGTGDPTVGTTSTSTSAPGPMPQPSISSAPSLPPAAMPTATGSTIHSPSASMGPLPLNSSSAKIDSKTSDVGRNIGLQTTPADNLSKITSLDKSARDPLAQLAAEFGGPLDQKKDVTKTSSSGGDHQIEWLESRIVTTRFILDRLLEKSRELEKQLHP